MATPQGRRLGYVEEGRGAERGMESRHEPKFDFSDTLECKPSTSKMTPLSNFKDSSESYFTRCLGLVQTPETIESNLKMIENLLVEMASWNFSKILSVTTRRPHHFPKMGPPAPSTASALA